MGIPIQLHKKLVEFFLNLPNIQNSHSQQAFLYSAGLDKELQNQLNVNQAPQQFVELLVSTCMKYGILQNGRDALEAVLEAAKNYIGQDGKASCDALIIEYRENRTIPQNDQMEKELDDLEQQLKDAKATSIQQTSQGNQTPNIITKSGNVTINYNLSREPHQQLQQERDKNQKDVSLFAPEVIPEVGLFFNRETLQENLKAFLKDSHQKAFIVHGMGGIGKTVFLAKVLQDVRESSLIYWHTCREDTNLERILGELNTFLISHNITSLQGIWNNPASSVTTRLNALIRGIIMHGATSKPIILVFDDMQRLLDEYRQIIDAEMYLFLKSLLIQCHPAKLVFASRFSPKIEGVPAGLQYIAHLEGLTSNASVLLLGEHGLQDVSPDVFEKLHQRVNGHPLGLVVMSQLWRRGYSIDEILLLPITMMAEESDETTFVTRLLTELWPLLQKVERRILAILSIYRSFVSFDALQYFFDVSIKKRMLQLVDCSLIQRKGDQKLFSYSIHPLLREYILDEFPADKQKVYHQKAATYWESLSWHENPTRVAQLQERIECRWHYYQAAEYEKASQIAFPLVTYLETRCGLYRQAINIILETQKHVTSEEDHATCYHHIGFVYDFQGDYSNALRYYEKSRKIREHLGLDIDLAKTYNNIGIVYKSQGDYSNALRYYEKSRKIREHLGFDIDLAKTYNNIGIVYKSQGDYSNALRYYAKSREIQERLGLEVDLARTYNNIGVVYKSQGDYYNALRYYEKSREIQERLGLDVDLARIYNNIGEVSEYYGNYSDALRYYEKSREIQERLGLDVDLARTYNNIGEVSEYYGNYSDALRYYKKSYDICRRIGWVDSEVMSNLEHIQQKMRSQQEKLRDRESIPAHDAFSGE